MIVAQISDMHVKRRGHVLHHMPHVAWPLRRALTAIGRLRPAPSCVIATGDLTESGLAAEYRRLREIIGEYPIPVYLVPGNHDRPDALRATFPDHGYLRERAGGVFFTIETPALRIVALDSSTQEHNGGSLGETALRWLQQRLHERPRTTTILALHHPPFPTGVPRFDRQRFDGRDAFAEIVRAHPQIRRIICGHVHQPLAREWCGTLCVSAPSTAPTLTLHPQRSGLSWEPGGFLLHCADSDGLTTSVVRTSRSDPLALFRKAADRVEIA